MTATKSPGHPAPLHDADGCVVATFSERMSNELFSDGERLRGGPFDLDVLIQCYPYKTYWLHEPQGVIGKILIAPEDCATLPSDVAWDVINTWFEMREGILLLALSAAARNAARRHINDLLANVLVLPGRAP
jgi:hypothetical protein